MNPLPNRPAEAATARDALALSLLNDFLFCARRAALKVLEGSRGENEHTVRGDIVHEHADLAGYEVSKGATLLRGLPVFSDRLGLSGKCDIVEVRGRDARDDAQEPGQGAAGGAGRGAGPYSWLMPVEYKKGKRRQFENDDVQVCAQALCLEEMFGVTVPRGAIFHAASKRRREVEFTPELRQVTEAAVHDLHALLDESDVSDAKSRLALAPLPAAVFKPACEECSLYKTCLPQLTSHPPALARAARELFEA
jgi:CRISPR-associated exonuclease Cas4